MPTALVTGASLGIGREVAKGLARMGYQVLMLSRESPRLTAAAEQVRAVAAEGVTVSTISADLSVLSEVRRAAAEARRHATKIDVIVNNAAVVPTERVVTPDGLESAFATNVLAPLVLAHALKDSLSAGEGGRVVNFFGGNHKKIDFDDLQFEKRKYVGWDAYGESKLCVGLLTIEMARRLVASGVTANCTWPGIVNTEGIRALTGFIGVMTLLMRPMMKTPEQGAACAVWLATAPELARVSGKFFGGMGRDFTKEIVVPEAARDLEAAKRLYETCERLARI